MKHVVLKPFGWYPNGYDREALVPGDERDFGDATDGLLAAMMIGKSAQAVSVAEEPIVPPEAPSAPVAAPDAADLDLSDTADKPRRGRPKKV